MVKKPDILLGLIFKTCLNIIPENDSNIATIKESKIHCSIYFNMRKEIFGICYFMICYFMILLFYDFVIL